MPVTRDHVVYVRFVKFCKTIVSLQNRDFLYIYQASTENRYYDLIWGLTCKEETLVFVAL